ncbi:Omp28-related outer membrane protein [Kaistella flava (ex Peng et al. 2021)]|uniref:Omp28-related outer membrane protein n=1 Tax=Kaistella flava (ex Peng et al. 2021) TaxID=2038776 RepID=A0A7M2Y4D8_9FLAO|nr:Omp28-related outer membrane protein [Kaistella flava (ex Peng et al. 2021)]QOW08980.1 Omp28-related outer membrane protein [Kaistella flava (ex Peng et al. 2021)]
MKKLYFLATAFYLTGFMNANSFNQKPITSKPAADNDIQVVSGKINKFLVAGSETAIRLTIKNVGTNNITSVEFNWNDGTGDHKEKITAYLNVGQQREITHPILTSYTDIASKNITLTITKVNDNADSNPADNNLTVTTSVVSQFLPKKVVFEEGTGTWCGWCPRGMVALDKVNEDYPNDQISIAVHNGDPMVLAAYNAGAAFAGYPGMNVDRELKGVDVSPNSIGNHVATRKLIAAPAKLSGEYSIINNQLTANVAAQFFIVNNNVNYRLAAVVVEDEVQGTASGYRQSNYYAGGGNGPMGGFENLPATVPANQMIYNHVGRALLGGYAGQTGSIPTSVTDEQIVNYTFSYTVPAAYNQEKLSTVLLLLDATDGTILNAVKLDKTALAVNNIKPNAANITLYPNPAKSDFNLKLAADGTYNVVIFDVSGKMVKNYGVVKSNSKTINLPINLTPGKYFVNISQDGNSITKDLLVK